MADAIAVDTSRITLTVAVLVRRRELQQHSAAGRLNVTAAVSATDASMAAAVRTSLAPIVASPQSLSSALGVQVAAVSPVMVSYDVVDAGAVTINAGASPLSDTTSDDQGGANVGLIIGVSVGVVALLLALVCAYKRHYQPATTSLMSMRPLDGGRKAEPTALTTRVGEISATPATELAMT